VLPTVDLITLREKVVGRPLLLSLGVEPDRIATTGDDALELAFRVEPAPTPGTRLGFNLRLARYSRVDQGSADMIGAAILDAAQRHATEPLPIAISLHPKEQDDAVAARLLSRPVEGEAPDSPLGVVERIQRCRIVVTGSYHAAVFALAQGIMVVGITQSPYYDAKFLGLKDQFQGLVGIVSVDRDVRARLTYEIDRSWQTADEVRPRLLELAALQVEQARSAYERLGELVTGSVRT
jgi:colanic acid/amylovoran biosynthesis protein